MKNSKRDLVVQSNDILRGKSSLSKIQSKIILKAISLITQEKSDCEKYYKIPISDFADDIDFFEKNRQKNLEEIASSIVSKTITIYKDEGSILITSWASSFILDQKKDYIKIRFAEPLKPYLLQLRSFFEKKDLENILLLNSRSSIRLYQLLKEYLSRGFLEIEISELKKHLGSRASTFSILRDKVLVPCQKEIEEKTDISFTFNPLKKENKIISLKFQISSKEENPPILPPPNTDSK